jgi:hypothetical protein
MLMAMDLARQLDPALWFEAAGIKPDPWQLSAIRSTNKRQLWNIHRRGGKSTCAALKALAKAQEPGTLCLCVSPAQRQGAELLRKVRELHARIANLPEIVSDSVHKLEFANHSRIVSLPSSESTVRGFSNVALLVLDEAARVPDDMIAACRPFLAVSAGELVCLSSPAGQRGFFYEEWTNGGSTWERFMVTALECDRISKEWLDEERRTLGEAVFEQEYLCRFVQNDEAAFPTWIIEKAFTDEVRPLWQ